MTEIIGSERFNPRELPSIFQDPDFIVKLLGGQVPAVLTITTFDGNAFTFFTAEGVVSAIEGKPVAAESPNNVVSLAGAAITRNPKCVKWGKDLNGNLVCERIG